MKVIKPPDPLTNLKDYSVFLAGSIEMGAAEDWQKDTERYLKPYDCTVLNPRRDDWDSSWAQTIHDPNFVEQVEWELKGLHDASSIMLYFAPGTQSPISLLEFGLYARYSEKLRVCCPDGFWRKGNVDIVCREYRVMQFPSLILLMERIGAEARNSALIN